MNFIAVIYVIHLQSKSFEFICNILFLVILSSQCGLSCPNPFITHYKLEARALEERIFSKVKSKQLFRADFIPHFLQTHPTKGQNKKKHSFQTSFPRGFITEIHKTTVSPIIISPQKYLKRNHNTNVAISLMCTTTLISNLLL